jgi:hypothetical protein
MRSPCLGVLPLALSRTPSSVLIQVRTEDGVRVLTAGLVAMVRYGTGTDAVTEGAPADQPKAEDERTSGVG